MTGTNGRRRAVRITRSGKDRADGGVALQSKVPCRIQAATEK
jgi:hypothetical protein